MIFSLSIIILKGTVSKRGGGVKGLTELASLCYMYKNEESTKGRFEPKSSYFLGSARV